MIQDSEIILLGTCTRTHGKQGELQVVSPNDLLSAANDPQFLFFRLDNILTPFRLLDWREKGTDAYIVTLDDISTEEQALRLCGSKVYLLRRDVAENPDEPLLTWQDFVGFELVDEQRGSLGQIKNVDDSTLNTLFLLEDGTILPAHEDFITSIDSNARQLHVSLPAGLL